MQFLPTLAADTTLIAINQAWHGWLDTYHQRSHSATGCAPWQRFADNMQCLRTPPDNLKDHFRAVARRTVAKDRTVTIDGRLFEAPVGLIGKRIDLLYHKAEMARVEARFNGKSYGLISPVDMAVNCRVKRDRNRNTQIDYRQPSTPKGGKIW